MRPEIQNYLDEHGAAYTPEALRGRLVDAGYDPVEVDTAMREWEARATHPPAAANERRRFWWWVLGLHAAVLLLIGLVSLAIGSFAAAGWLALAILAMVLLVGVGVSGAIGRAVLAHSGLTIALVAPAVSALLIGGSCLAFGGSLLLQQPPPPPRTGVMDLSIDPPGPFAGSGPATCQTYADATGFNVFAENLGTLDGRQVSVSIEAFAADAPGGPAPAPGEAFPTSMFITLMPPSPADRQIDYGSVPSSHLELDASPDGQSGSIEFQALEAALDGVEPGDGAGLEPISGSVSWSCE